MIQWSSNQLISTLMSSAIALAVNISVMFYLNWKLTVLMMLILPFYGITYQFFSAPIKRYTEGIRERNSKLWGLSQEKIAGIQVVKCFNREVSEALGFFRVAREQLRDVLRRAALSAGMSTACSLFYYGGFVAVAWWGTFMLRDGYWSGGEFVWFNSLCLLSFPRFLSVFTILTPWRELRTNLQRVFDILDEPVTVDDPEPGVELKGVGGEVQFLNVTLRYPDQPFDSLKDIDLTIPAGTKVSLMGPSGAGKSSLAKLLQRLYDPTEGCVLLDGHNLKDIRLKSLRESVVRVPQETVIFSGTIAENIRYGWLDASNKRVVSAAEDAELHEFIMTLPEKYETALGEMGFNLSGGQKQRLALARALLTDPAILILDDTTSALDAETSARVEATLDRILEGRTAFIITHRLATAMRADLILLMEGGQIAEMGTHRELMEKRGLYYKVYKQQIGEVSEDAA